MNAVNWFAPQWSLDLVFCQRWTITLLHSLWQGAAIAALTCLILWCLRNSSARARYAVSVSALSLLIACLPVTFSIIRVPAAVGIAGGAATTDVEQRSPQQGLDSPAESQRNLAATSSASILDTDLKTGTNSNIAPSIQSLPELSYRLVTDSVSLSVERHSAVLTMFAQFATVAYLLGVMLMLCRLGWALRTSSRLMRNAVVVTDPQLVAFVRQRARAMGLRVLPVLQRCEQIAVPIVMGIVKPLILIPGSMSTGLEPHELEAILTHELAHLRRFDLLVNLLQRVVESVLFFHPAVWYLSRRVSLERELSCDDLVLTAGHGRLQYAGALIRMAELAGRIQPVQASNLATLAAAGSGPSQLKLRVMRLLGQPMSVGITQRGLWCIVAMLLLAVGSPLVSRQLNAAQDKPALSPQAAPDKPQQKTASPQPNATVPKLEDYRRTARERQRILEAVATSIQKHELNVVTNHFSDELRKSLPKDKLEAIWKRLTEKLGPQRDADARRGDEYGPSGLAPLFAIRVTWQQKSLDILIDFDDQNKIAGIWIPNADKQTPQSAPTADDIFGKRMQQYAAWNLTLKADVVDLDGQPSKKCRIRFYREVSSTEPLHENDCVETESGKRWRVFSHQATESTASAKHLPPGWYRVVAWGNHGSSGPIGVSPPVELVASELTTAVTVNLVAGATLRVTSTQADNGNVLERAGVKLQRMKQTWPPFDAFPKKEEGVTVFEHLPPAQYRLSAYQSAARYDAPRYETLQDVEVDLQRNETRELRLTLQGRPLTDAEQAEYAPWIVTGRVTDPDGKPVPGAEIWASAGWGSLRSSLVATTDAEGRYHGRFGQSGIRFLHEEETDPLDIVSAQVGAHKQGLSEINLNRQGGMHAANREPRPDEKLMANADRTRLFIKGQPREVNFVLTPAAQITMKLIDKDDRPLGQKSVALDGKELPPASSAIDSATTDDAGQVLFQNVPAGFAWSTEIRLPDRRSARSQPLKLQGGQRYDILLKHYIEPATEHERLAIVKATDAAGHDVRGTIIVDDPFTRAPVEASQQQQGREILRKVRDVNRYWLVGPPPEVKKYSYEFHLRDKPAQQITVSTPSTGAIYQRRGISYYSALDYLTAHPDEAIFRLVKVGDEQIELVYAVPKVIRISAGNGVAGSWAGYFSSGVREGQLKIDAKTYTPLEHRSDEKIDTFSNYTELRPGYYVPLRIQVSHMKFDWQFKVHEPGLWLFDTLTQPLPDGQTVRITKVVVESAK